jgi:hypothetical protein
VDWIKQANDNRNAPERYQCPLLSRMILHDSVQILLTVKGVDVELRTRKLAAAHESSANKDEEKQNKKYEVFDPIGLLKARLRTVRHQTYGWLREDLMASATLDGSKEALYNRVWADYNAQLIHVRAQRDILEEDYDPLHIMPGRDGDGKFTFTKNVDVPKNYLTLAYLLYAYGMDQSTFKRLRLRGGAALTKQLPHNKGLSIVTDQQYASTVFARRIQRPLEREKKQGGSGYESSGTLKKRRIRNLMRHTTKKAVTTTNAIKVPRVT